MITQERRAGFTLIEILIVVAIIAILASVVLVGLGPTQQSGRDARRISDLREVQNGLELYYNKCGYYPGASAPTSPCPTPWTETKTWLTMSPILQSSNIGVTVVPDDPTNGQHYYYDSGMGGANYVIAAKLENVNNAVFNGYVPPNTATLGVTNLGVVCNPAATAAGIFCLSL